MIISLALGAVVWSEYKRRYDFMLLERSFETLRSQVGRKVSCCYKCTNDIGESWAANEKVCKCKCHKNV